MGAPLTAERLRHLLEYNPETRKFVRRERTANNTTIGEMAGGRDDRGYVRIRVDGTRHRASRLAWLYMTGEWPKALVDHRNCDTADNVWTNLRLADNSKNIANSRRRKDNASGFKGVWWNAVSGQWQAAVTAQKEKHHLGLFDCPVAAHLAYLVKASVLHGEFARGA